MTQTTKTEHRANLVKNHDVVSEFIEKLGCIPPGEMFKVMTERSEPMVYVPWNWFVTELWGLALELENQDDQN